MQSKTNLIHQGDLYCIEEPEHKLHRDHLVFTSHVENFEHCYRAVNQYGSMLRQMRFVHDYKVVAVEENDVITIQCIPVNYD